MKTIPDAIRSRGLWQSLAQSPSTTHLVQRTKGRTVGWKRTAIDMDKIKVGSVFGNWTVLGTPQKIGHRYKIRCRCACGTERLVDIYSLVMELSTSCRCKTRRVGGVSLHPLYNVWKLMIYRCYGDTLPKEISRRYRDRGILVCDEWRYDVETFVKWCLANGWHKGLHLDRKDNDKGYCPDNCHFVTPTQNARNTCANRKITYKGETLCIAEWAEKMGKSPDLISQRFSNGWSAERALEHPVRKRIILTHEGITAPLGVLADKCGVPRMTARHRYMKGYPLRLVFANRKLKEEEKLKGQVCKR